MPHLISPGPGRSGTTLLYNILAESPDFAPPIPGKEFYYFRADSDRPYESFFEKRRSPKTVYFEFSPPYMSDKTQDGRAKAAQRIKEAVPDAVILFTLRHPLYRSISHYIHQLHDFSRYGWERYSAAGRDFIDLPCCITFEQAVSVDTNIRTNLSRTIKLYMDLFGPDQCMFFFLETDTKDLGDFYSRLRTRFDLAPDRKWNGQVAPTVLKTTTIPSYHYGGENGTVLRFKEGEVTLPKHCLYIANARGHEVVPGIDPLTGENLLAAQEYWTSDFDAKTLRKVNERHFEADLRDLMQLLRNHPDSSRCPDYLNQEILGRSVPREPPSYWFLMNYFEQKQPA